jgi:hypothetical protein
MNTETQPTEGMDEFLDGLQPNQYIRKSELKQAGPFTIANIHEQRSRRYNRDEWVLSLALVDDDDDAPLRMISFGKENQYVDSVVRKWKKFHSEGKDTGVFLLKEVETNRFRFCRPE